MSVSARAQSQPIATPQVRPLAAGEVAARRVIIASLAARSSQSPRASPDPGAAPSPAAAPGPAAAPAAEQRAGDGAAAAAPAAAPGGAGPGGGGGGGGGGAAAEADGGGQGAGQGASKGPGEGADPVADGWASDSSGEATDDEAFAAQHQPEETAEYIRNRVHKGARLALPALGLQGPQVVHGGPKHVCQGWTRWREAGVCMRISTTAGV
jgi:hypothetical protein